MAGEAAPSGVVRYVSGIGNDADPGSSSQPWRSLVRVQSAIDTGALRAGDAILFSRGYSYFGSLALGSAVQGTAGAPILFAAYGVGTAPSLHGMRTLTAWQSLGAGRWRAICAECTGRPALLRIDGVSRRVARWPNDDEADHGYRYFTATNGSTSITDAALPAGRNWVGGELAVRSIAWVIDRLAIVAQSGGTLTTSVASSYPLQVGYGYFIQNHPDAIDREGEWAYTAADHSITLQSATDPNARSIDVPIVDTLLQVRGAANVTVRDLVLAGASRRAVDAQGGTGLRLRRVRAGHVGDQVVSIESCPDSLIEDSIVAESMNNGLRMTDCAACTLQRTTVQNIGLFAGMGANGDGAYIGAEIGGVAGRPATVLNTAVNGIGYLGVRLEGLVSMSGSLVSNFNQVKVDGAGIYTYRKADISITDNTVLDAGGTTAGTPWSSTATHGIYLDDNSERVTVARNTVGRVGASGVYLHNTRDASVTDNLVYGAGEAGILMTDDTLGTYALERSLVRGNTVVASGVPMLDISSSVTDSLFGTLGTIDANRFCDPFASPTVRVGLPSSPSASLPLAQWRSQYGRDTASTVCTDRLSNFAVIGTPGQSRMTNGSFDTDLSGWFGWPSDTLDARWETARLDGGSLRLGFAGPSPQLHFDNAIGAVAAGQSWWLEFSAISLSGTPSLNVYLRQAGSPYNKLGNTVSLAPEGTRSNYSLLLDSSLGEANALLIFEMQRAGTAVGIDNVRLRQVTVTRVGLADVARLETNASTQPRSITVSGKSYRTPDGTLYAPGSVVTLAPYRSIVLLAQ